IIDLTGSETKVEYIGTRHGEKLYETLVTAEEMARAEDKGDFFRIRSDNRDLNYAQYFSEGNKKLNGLEPYTSHNTNRLNIRGMKTLLSKLEPFGGAIKQHDEDKR
ncbi:MAG: polysaccharide biosynthesis protein, partial [Bacilli bacterium]|nr:polysaccharide biosynthesis protein [Bacilli bacterium]